MEFELFPDLVTKSAQNYSNNIALDIGYYTNNTFNTSQEYSEYSVLENWWSVFDKKYLRHSIQWTIVLLIAYIFILIIGTIGNLMVILVVVKRPQMRTITNIFIMNLAVADLLVIVFCVPVTLLANAFFPWILGSFMCKGVAYVQGVSVCASAYSLAAVSLDRSRAISKSNGQPSGLTRNQAICTIFLIWAISLTLLIPWAVVFDVTSPDEHGITSCIEIWENDYLSKIYFVCAIFISCYCLPLLLICITNMIIWCHVSHRKVPHDSASSRSIKKMHRKARHGVIKMLGIVTLIFLLSWLPLYIIVMRHKLADNLSESEINLWESLMPFAQWLGSWNSSINPIIYAFLNKKFRDMFKSLLPAWMPFAQKSYFLRRTSYFKATGKRNRQQRSTGVLNSKSLSEITQKSIKRYESCRAEKHTIKGYIPGKRISAEEKAWNTNQPESQNCNRIEGKVEVFVISEFVRLTCSGTAVEL